MLFQKGYFTQKQPYTGLRPCVAFVLMISGCMSVFAASQSFAVSQNSSKTSNAVMQTLNFQQILLQVEKYQAQQGIWETQMRIADANLKQSQLRSNPNLTVQQTGFGSGQDRELEMGISQQVDVFGVRKTARQVAQLQHEQVALNQQLYQAQMQLAVKAQWAQVLVLQMEQHVAQAQLKTSQENLNATRLRYQAGSIAQVDLDRQLMAHIENQRQAQQAQLNLTIAKQQLANLWGGDRASFQIDSESDKALLQTDDLIRRYEKENLYQKSLQLQQKQQQAQITYLKAQAKPTPTVSVGMVRSQDQGESRVDHRFRVGVEIPLTIFDRQQYPQQALQAKQAFLDQKQQFYRQHQQQAIQTALSELRGLRQQFDLVKDQQVPLSEVVQRKTLLGFQAGKYAITDVQQATLQLQQQRLQKVQLLKSAWQKAIEAESLALGVDPNLVQSKDALWQINQTLWQETDQLPVVKGASE